MGTKYAAVSKEQVYNYLPGLQRGIIYTIEHGTNCYQQPDSHSGMEGGVI